MRFEAIFEVFFYGDLVVEIFNDVDFDDASHSFE